MPVLIRIDANSNCAAVDGLVFTCRNPPRPVTHVALERFGRTQWLAATGMDEPGTPVPATACLIDDSGDGACYLVVGGSWGLRFKAADDDRPWALDDAGQWGEPFLILGGDGADLRFLP